MNSLTKISYFSKMSESHEEQVSSYISSHDEPSAPPTEETNGFDHIEKNEIDNALNSVSKQVEEAVAEEVKKPEVTETKPAPAAKSVESTKKVCAACPYTFLGRISISLTCCVV